MAIIGIDLDGTLADWDEGHDAVLDTYGDAAVGIPRSYERQVFDLFDGLTAEQAAIMTEAMDAPSFYRNLKPFPYAIEGTRRLAWAGHDIVFVSTPWTTNATCASDKIAWVAEHFGPDWTRRVILTSDKTLVQVDYLIDDRGEISGRVAKPSWQHVVFGDWKHNSQSLAPIRLPSWDPEHVEGMLTHIARQESSSVRD